MPRKEFEKNHLETDLEGIEEISIPEYKETRLPKIKNIANAWNEETEAQKLERKIANRRQMRQARRSFGDKEELDNRSPLASTSSESSLSSISSTNSTPQFEMESSREGVLYMERKKRLHLPPISLKQSNIQNTTDRYKQELSQQTKLPSLNVNDAENEQQTTINPKKR